MKMPISTSALVQATDARLTTLRSELQAMETEQKSGKWRKELVSSLVGLSGRINDGLDSEAIIASLQDLKGIAKAEGFGYEIRQAKKHVEHHETFLKMLQVTTKEEFSIDTDDRFIASLLNPQSDDA